MEPAARMVERKPRGARKAGVAPNHWYGCFEPAWLDDWGAECRVAGEEGHHLDVGRAHLSKISAAAVLGCQTVWRAVTWCLWRAAQRPRERRGGRWTRSDPPDEDPDVLATHNPAFLNFVERKMYVAATEALPMNSEKLLGRRTLSAEEKSIIKWRSWTCLLYTSPSPRD